MKFCLSSRQSKQYLEKADEIKVDFRDRNTIPELADEYPGKTIILVQYAGDELNGDDLATWKILTKDHFIVCLSNLAYVADMKRLEIPWYWGFPVTSFYQLRALKEMGACYAKLDAPIFFDMPTAKKIGVPIRVVPNVAYIDGLERTDGVCGTWIRPEDLEAYGEFVEAVEFEDCNQKKEQAMYRIYAEDKKWPTDLGLLITNLNHAGTNRMIGSEYSLRRLDCGQRCQENDGCHICYRLLYLANPKLIKDYVNATSE